MKSFERKKNLCSAITISGELTIAHYLFVILPLLKIVDRYNLFIAVADLHAITTQHNPQHLHRLRYQTVAYLLACRLPEETLFIQSQIHGHSKLCFILGCHVNLGTLMRMTQFKSKSKTNLESLALLNYPLLMASDILLYDADVLVGNDQKQHIELIRDLAIKLNTKMGRSIFYPPEIVQNTFFPYRLRDLQQPEKKMSKSNDHFGGTIFLSDTRAQITKKLLTAKTDCDNSIHLDFTNKPGISNLILLYALLTNVSLEQSQIDLQKRCTNYQDLKLLIADKICNLFAPIQKQANYFLKNIPLLKTILQKGRDRAQKTVDKKFATIEQTLGFAFEL